MQLEHCRKVVLLAQPAARAVAAPLVRQEALLGCERSTPSQLRGRLRVPTVSHLAQGASAKVMKQAAWTRQGACRVRVVRAQLV